MPWNNETGGGGWKSGGNGGGGGPWGQGPWGGGGSGGGGKHQQPDLEEILKRSQDRLKRVMPGGQGGGAGIPTTLWLLLFAIGLSIAAFYLCTFKVDANQQGLILRFGKYQGWQGPGLHFKLPYPIDQVILQNVTDRNQIEIGMRAAAGGRSGRTISVTDIPEESLMLTGDENIIDIDFVVLWRIKTGRDAKSGQTGAEQFSFNLQFPRTTVKEVGESAMREVVGKRDIQPILTEDRTQVETAVQKLMQTTLDSYGAGIEITQVQLQKVDPPGRVIGAFRDVQAARTDQGRLQNEAQAYFNRIVPEARGQAERILQAAAAYKQQTVDEATGQAARFLKVYEEYRKAPDITRRRMFLETMEKVLGGTEKIIMDNKGGSGVVPYLPLGELKRSAPSTPQGGN